MKLKRTLLLLAIGMVLAASNALAQGDIKPVPFTDVHITDQFWKQRLDVMQNTTIRYAFEKCDQAGQIRNFEYAGMIVSGEKLVGELTVQSSNPYDDAEVYKVLEGASYVLKVSPDAELENYCDGVIDKIVSAQEPDGYLQTFFTIHNPLHPWYGGEKWKMDWNLSHETFNVGELIECGIAYYQATGKNKLLNCAIKAADNMLSVFNEDGIKMAPGHAVVEMALVRLYELTGEEKYLNGCKFFLDCRGIRQFDPSSLDQRMNGKYWQDHLPAIEQRSAEGHAVRAMYFYSGMADWVRYSNDQDYETAVTAIWDNIASKKFYITGGFGARDNNEAFGEDYELPNATAYCETCASVAGTMFNERMFRLHGESKYIDMLERALYNTVLDGYGIKGKTFYYPNRLASQANGNERSEWFGTSCCPTNLCRLIPSVPGYVYAQDLNSLYINLFVDSKATITLGAQKFDITQSTSYPYDGNVKIAISNREDLGTDNGFLDFIKVRIPGWAVNKPVESDLYSFVNPTTSPVIIKVNGQEVTYETKDGYALIPAPGVEEIEMLLPMDVHQVVSNAKLKTNDGLRSFERGPLVYCMEGADNQTSFDNLYIPEDFDFTTSTIMYDTFNGNMPMLKVSGKECYFDGNDKKAKDATIKLIPYFARANRGKSAMKVWIPVDDTHVAEPVDYVDEVIICNEASEQAHGLKGTNMRTGSDLGWRDSDGGYIQYTLKVLPDKPMDLILKHWGSDAGNRRFNIYCGPRIISYDEIENFKPNEYYFMHHALPYELTKDKTEVTIKMQSIDGSLVGGLYGVYTAISENTPDDTTPVDYMTVALQKNRNDHNYQSNGEIGTFRQHTWADGHGEEGQSWTMKVDPTHRNYLMIYYWGGEWDARSFDIYCDDILVDSELLCNNDPGRFFYRTYIIPEEGTSGKDEVTIHLTSPQGTKTGGIFYAFMMAPEEVSEIEDIMAQQVSHQFYTLGGIRLGRPRHGINIIDGKKLLTR